MADLSAITEKLQQTASNITVISPNNSAVLLVVILLASKYALKSKLLEMIFNNYLGSAVLLYLTCYVAFKDVQIAAVVTGVLILGNIITDKFFPAGKEGFDSENRDIAEGCMTVTYDDLLKAFDGDKDRLSRAMFNAVNTNYTSPALSATQLLNKGYPVPPQCKII